MSLCTKLFHFSKWRLKFISLSKYKYMLVEVLEKHILHQFFLLKNKTEPLMSINFTTMFSICLLKCLKMR